MGKIAYKEEIAIRRAIRDAFAIDPLMDQKKLIEHLNLKFQKPLGSSFDTRYIGRLTRKVNGELAVRADKEKIGPRLISIRETSRLARENLIVIAYGQGLAGRTAPTYGERIAAWRAIALIEKLQLDAELELGIYNKDLREEKGKSFRYREIPAEIMDAMITTAKMWQLPTGLTRTIEPEVIQTAEIKKIEENVAKPIIPNQSIQPDPELRLS